MIWFTGDKHGDYSSIKLFCESHDVGKDAGGDYMVVLGDNGVNYFGGKKDRRLKAELAALPITFFMVRGNHDQRPSLKSCREEDYTSDYVSGPVLVEDEFPNILYAKDGGMYDFGGTSVMVIGGAYSVDKFLRLERQAQGFSQYRWFPDEQLTKAEMDSILETARAQRPDVILSHTCPYSMIPWDRCISNVYGGPPDYTMEHWMDEVNRAAGEPEWFCGHWHIDRRVPPNIRFMYYDFLEF